MANHQIPAKTPSQPASHGAFEPKSGFEETVKEVKSRQERGKKEIHKWLRHSGIGWVDGMPDGIRVGTPAAGVQIHHDNDFLLSPSVARLGGAVHPELKSPDDDSTSSIPAISQDSAWTVLNEIGSFSIAEQNQIVEKSHRVFVEASPSELRDEDLFTLQLLLSSSDRLGRDDIMSNILVPFEEYFKEEDLNIDVIRRSSSDADPVSPEDALSIYKDEAERIRKATENTYTDKEPEQIEQSIRWEQKRVLLIALSKMQPKF